MSLTKRYERALDRENIAISMGQDRNKRVIKKVFEKGEGNTITDRVISVLERGLKAERNDKIYREDKPEKSNWKEYIQEDENMKKSELVNFIKSNFGEPELKHK